MVFQVLLGLPPFLDEQNAVILHIHVAIAAYAAALEPDLAKYRFNRLKDLLPFFNGNRHLNYGFDHGGSP
jgi:hypothetical protein